MSTSDATFTKMRERIAELERDLAFSYDQRIGEIDRFNGQALRAEMAEAERDALKVCGSCGEWRPEGGRCYMGDDGTVFTNRLDPCHFAPSRWMVTA